MTPSHPHELLFKISKQIEISNFIYSSKTDIFVSFKIQKFSHNILLYPPHPSKNDWTSLFFLKQKNSEMVNPPLPLYNFFLSKKILWKKCFCQKILAFKKFFWYVIFFVPHFFGQKNILDKKTFRDKNFLGQKFFLAKKFFVMKNFFHSFFCRKKFFDKKIFLRQFFFSSLYGSNLTPHWVTQQFLPNLH